MTSWINPKIIIKDTGEKGVGSFANAPILKDEVVIIQGGRILDYKQIMNSDYKPFCDHCFQVDKDFLICPIEPKKESMDGVYWVNHSCNPSCGFQGQIILIAMRDIQVGEEITYDYAMTDSNWGDVFCAEMECLCGASNCRKIITGEDWKSRDLQEKYKGYTSMYIRWMITSK